MFSHNGQALSLLIGAFLVVLVLVLILPAPLALANGSHVPSREIYNGPAGPYYLTVAVVPQVKNFHLTVYVALPDGITPVDYAQVHVLGRGPGTKDETGSIALDRPSGGVNLYLANLPVEKGGIWTLAVTVDSRLGQAVAEMEVEAVELPLISPNIVLLGLAFLGAIAFFEVRRWQRRRRQRPQAGAGA